MKQSRSDSVGLTISKFKSRNLQFPIYRYHGPVETHPRTMALDVGDRRIGIALTDALGLTVQGRPTRIRTNLNEDIDHIRMLIEEDHVRKLVVGYPKHMDGKASHQTEKTKAFVRKMESVLSIPIIFWDERLTSFAAEEHLKELGLDWRKRKKHVDELAATLILEDYLSRRS